MKLIAISPPDSIRALVRAIPSKVEVDSNIEVTKGWIAVIRGPVVRFVSPPSWGTQAAPARSVLEVARAQCALHWSVDSMAELDQMDKYESPVFGPGAYAEPVKEKR